MGNGSLRPGGGFMSAGFTGAVSGVGRNLYRWIASDAAKAVFRPGICTRLRFLDRVLLTPEGITHAEHRPFTRKMLNAGHRIFSFTYHSPSLAPYTRPVFHCHRNREVM